MAALEAAVTHLQAQLHALWTRLLLKLLESSGHLLVEGFLLAAVVYLLLSRARPPQKKPLTEEEIDALCEEWQPEPLVPPMSDAQLAFKPPILAGPTGPHVKLEGGKEAINFVSFNFLGLAGNKEAACAAAITKYGVGSCGPRGFYGTIDVHLELEGALRSFMGTEDGMIYSYDVATPASTIPAFAKRGDVLVMDEGVNYAIQNGASLSRSDVLFFKHNDVADLRRVLVEYKESVPRGAPLNRRFICVEGVYANYGDTAPLRELSSLASEFCYRLLVDESVALGALPGGARGRGAAEAAGLSPTQVDITTGSLGNTLGGVGGFCVGSKQVIAHQRLNAAGYVFSASLPPYLAAGALASLRLLTSEGDAGGGGGGGGGKRRAALAALARRMRRGVAALPGLARVAGDDDCPLLHVRPASFDTIDSPPGSSLRDSADALLERVCGRALDRAGVLFCVSKYSVLERRAPPPSIRIAVSAAHTPADVDAGVEALCAALKAEGVV